MPDTPSTLLSVQHLKKYFPIRRGILSRVAAHVKAVDDISFDINKGETFGLVGESGCGKTTAGRAVLRLIEPDEGKIRFDGIDLLALNAAELRRKRRDMQIIFQDPYASLNPRMTIRAIVGEPFVIHGMTNGKSRHERSECEPDRAKPSRDDEVAHLLKTVGLDPSVMNRYPHEFSGGQRQRIGIARALALKPKLIVADEPVSALDVSIQAQIINLLADLQQQFGLTYFFISHAIPVIEHISTRIGVMYLGKLVEVGASAQICLAPMHPYTQALLSAVPIPDPAAKKQRIVLRGDVPTPINPPSGCRFHTRCPIAVDRCKVEEPPLRQVRDGRDVACHLVE
ncbi:MAG: ATP-binding cassette domain-containing protein [Acidobacteria bacterium]|nr:ATP-binding cassette domain-containing protein [Acidobacteriota bacterium]